MMNNLIDIWEEQIKDSTRTVTRETIQLKNGINCYAGFIHVSLNKMFQVEINKEVSIHKNYLKRFHGVEIRVLVSSEEKKEITIILSDNDLLDVFVLFIEDMIKGLESIDNENDVPLIVNQKVSYWGKLFAKIKGELLSKERQRGLYGELTFLKTLLNHSSDHVKSINSWTGPEGSNQDFSNEVTAVEIKTSKATKPEVKIANELQLDWTILESLFLNVFHIDEINNGIDTLMKLILEIKEVIGHQNSVLRLFEEKLNQIGIPVGEEKNYDDFGFIIRSQKAYWVQEGFPVLITKKINNVAIHNVQYEIDLTVCEQFEVKLENVISKMI